MRPEPRLLGALTVWLATAVGAAFVSELTLAARWLPLAIALVAGADLWRASRLATPAVSRQVPGALALRNWTGVTLRFANDGDTDLNLEWHDHHPPCGEVRQLPGRLLLPARSGADVRYRFRPLERGAWSFGTTELRMRSPWGLWQVRRHAGAAGGVKVYPDFGAVRRYAILATDNRTSQLGVRRRQRRGAGLELHQLRQYRLGDSLRQIDWKATSRRRKFISREYEDERNQQLVFLLDCGRNMRTADRGVAHFDHALNAVLLLTYVALRQGDAVGLMTMGGPDLWLAPRKGPGAMQTLLEGVYGLGAGIAVPDYATAATRLTARQRRRALVVLISNLRDEDSDELTSAIRLLRRRHLVLLASLREAVLDELLRGEVGSLPAALRLAATHRYLAARRRSHEAVRGHGILGLDVTPAALPVAVVNRYLEAKRDGTL